MTNLPITAPKETRAIATLVCTACGAPGEGSCGCGAPYVSPGQRAAEAIRQNPERSNVAIAEELGVDEGTIRYQRKKVVPRAEGLLRDDLFHGRRPDKPARRDGLDH